MTKTTTGSVFVSVFGYPVDVVQEKLKAEGFDDGAGGFPSQNLNLELLLL